MSSLQGSDIDKYYYFWYNYIVQIRTHPLNIGDSGARNAQEVHALQQDHGHHDPRRKPARGSRFPSCGRPLAPFPPSLGRELRAKPPPHRARYRMVPRPLFPPLAYGRNSRIASEGRLRGCRSVALGFALRFRQKPVHQVARQARAERN